MQKKLLVERSCLSGQRLLRESNYVRDERLSTSDIFRRFGTISIAVLKTVITF
jgi:hypothetical protein